MCANLWADVCFCVCAGRGLRYVHHAMTATLRDGKGHFLFVQAACLALLGTAACATGVDVDDGTAIGAEAPAPPETSGSGSDQVTGLGPASGGSTSTGGSGGMGGNAGEPAGGAAGAGGGTGGNGGAPTTPGLEASYSFEDTGNKILDDSGHANHGLLAPSGATILAGGKSGNALSFSGGSGYVRVPANASLDFKSAATIELWVKLSSVSAGTIVSRLSASGEGVRVRSSQGNVQVTFSREGLGTAVATTDPGLLGSTWTHVAIVNNGTELRIYIDGKLSRTEMGGKLGSAGPDLFIGSGSASDNAINGYVDELSWWSVALDAEDICTDAGHTWANGACS